MNYKLPPMPEASNDNRKYGSAGFHATNGPVYTAEQMQAYAIAAIEAQGVPDGWQPIETAPKAGTPILLAAPKGRIADGNWHQKYGVWIWPYVMAEPTHWIPLPAATNASAPPAPQAEIVEATQPHSTNNYLFKLLCEKAGIVLGVDQFDTACEKVARMSPCVDSKCPNYWDDAYDDLKPGDIETDCEPAPQDVVGHQSPDPMGDSDKKEQPHKAFVKDPK